MKFTDSPTEQTTALTDALLFCVATAGGVFLKWQATVHPWKANLWCSAFALIGMAALFGTCAHGFELTEKARTRIWRLLNLCLGLAVSLFAVGVVYDLTGKSAAARMLPAMIAAGMIFFLLTLRYPGTFFIFTAFEALALLFALGAYGWMAWRSSVPGAHWMAAGVLTSLAAAVLQAIPTVRISIIRPLDHNGVFHLVQTLGLLLLIRGIVA